MLGTFSSAHRLWRSMAESRDSGLLRYRLAHDGPYPGGGHSGAGGAHLSCHFICLPAWRGCRLYHYRGCYRICVAATRANLIRARTTPADRKIPAALRSCPGKIAAVPCGAKLLVLNVTRRAGTTSRVAIPCSGNSVRDPGEQAQDRNGARSGWTRGHVTTECAAAHLIQTH